MDRPRDIAPRLARAHDQLVAERHWRQWYRLELLDEVLRNERLVVHRELQELRAGQVNKRKYVNRRGKKLAEARLRLERARAQLTEFEQTPIHVLLRP